MLSDFAFICTNGGFMCEGPSSLLWIPIIAMGYLIMYGPYYFVPISAVGFLATSIYQKIRKRKLFKSEQIIIWALSIVVSGFAITMLLIVLPTKHAAETYRIEKIQDMEKLLSNKERANSLYGLQLSQKTACRLSDVTKDSQKYSSSGTYLELTGKADEADQARWIFLKIDLGDEMFTKKLEVCSDTKIINKGLTSGLDSIKIGQPITVEFTHPGNYAIKISAD